MSGAEAGSVASSLSSLSSSAAQGAEEVIRFQVRWDVTKKECWGSRLGQGRALPSHSLRMPDINPCMCHVQSFQSSAPAGFWQELAKLKVDVLGLDQAPLVRGSNN